MVVLSWLSSAFCRMGGAQRYPSSVITHRSMGIAALHPSYESTNLAVALPDQDQADGAEQRAIAGPLQLIDHEARPRPGNRAGALTDPQQANGKRQKADDRKRSGHGFPPVSVLRLAAFRVPPQGNRCPRRP